jgi:DNA-directed RNA polymerase
MLVERKFMEENILDKLVTDLEYRQSMLDKRQSASFLSKMSARDIIEFSYTHVLKGLERKATLVEVASSIGRRLRQKLRQKQNSVLDVQGGWFVLISYIELGILGYRKKHTYRNGKKDKHRSYFLFAKDWQAIKELMDLVDTEKCDMFPVNSPPEPWTQDSFHNDTGISVIKKGYETALKYFENNDMSYLIDTLNKLNQTAWRINDNVFSVYKQCMHSEKNPFKFTKEIDPIKRASLIIEAEAIQRLAEKHSGKPFYHLYNFDFRGRIYPNTAFLHEQSSDNAKGILELHEPVELGDQGYYWLCVHTANVWGNDKVSLDDRVEWVGDMIGTILDYANYPMKFTGWMDADKPFSFLAACYELKMIHEWMSAGMDVSEFPSCLPVYIDGSNNGVQHLVAVSQDDEVAPLVNLVPSRLPGDVYMFIAEKVWERLKDKVDSLDQETIDKFDETFQTAIKLQRAYENAPEKSERKALAFQEAQSWRNKNRDLREKLFAVYWHNIQDKKIQRKTVKRNVMTLGYGGTSYGMGQQVIEDTRDISEYLRDKEHLWGALLGALVYNTCYEELKGPAQMLRLFQTVAERANKRKEHMNWISPITGFPVVQAYRKPTNKRTELKYGDDILKVQLQVWEETTVNETKQKTGAAPNVVHSLDAVHLTMCIHDAEYPVTVVHDSFGSHAGNMDKMFYHVRQKFVELYEAKPLENILEQLQSIDLVPEKGNLDVRSVLESDFAFA